MEIAIDEGLKKTVDEYLKNVKTNPTAKNNNPDDEKENPIPITPVTSTSMVHSSLRRRELYRYSSLNPRGRMSMGILGKNIYTPPDFGGGNDILFIDRVYS